MDIKQKIKDEIRKRVSDEDIITLVVKKSGDQELKEKYKECRDMLKDPSLSIKELENLESQLSLFEKVLKQNNKRYIIYS